jgi:hypothetical protein
MTMTDFDTTESTQTDPCRPASGDRANDSAFSWWFITRYSWPMVGAGGITV